jgi:diguanylate cyclase (GGDEF)-like protein
VEVRQHQVVTAGLRTWLIALSLILTARAYIALGRVEYATAVPHRAEALLGTFIVTAALASAMARPRSARAAGLLPAIAGALTLLGAAFVTLSSLHPGYGAEVMHGVVIILMIGMPMLVPLPIRGGVALLAAIAITYPMMQLTLGTARASDPMLAAQVVDLSAGFGMAVLALVLHNVLFAGRWRALGDLARMAERDGLTGALNRRAFAGRMLAEADRARRYHTSLGVIMVDIDQFKRFNSELGYAAGDAMLRAVSLAVQGVTGAPEYARLGPTMARYGGEEFVVVVAGASRTELADMADAIRRAVANVKINGDAQVTASVGHAHVDDGARCVPATILDAADRALYRAKRAGGDRTEPAEPADLAAAGPSARLAVRSRKATPARTRESTRAAAVSDARLLHGVVLRWMFAVTATWSGMLTLMDVALVSGPYALLAADDFRLGSVVVARACLVLALLAFAAYGPRLPWWHDRLATLHALFVIGISAAILWMMERSGGVTSPYFGQLVYVIGSWSLAFSVRPAGSVTVLFAATMLLPVYYACFAGVPLTDHDLMIRSALLFGTGMVALGTQSIFSGLRGEEVTAREALDQLARIDPLTNLPNRVAFEEHAGKLMARAADTSDSRLSLLIVDMDHFKTLNDTYGHVVGDEALIRVATTLEQSLRAGDVAARLGGEEFVVALPMTDLEGARLSAERIRAGIEGVAVLGGTVPLRASVGVATLEDGEDLDGLLARADDALRRAKSLGRNRVEVAS